MPSGFVIRKNQYYDSVFLMSVNRRIGENKGVQQTAVLMGTPANKQLLADINIHDSRIDAAQPNDLIVVVIAETSAIVEDVLNRLDEWLTFVEKSSPPRQAVTFEDGFALKPQANLAVISVPGEYAAHEAKKALQAGLNVFVFSDNVPIEAELELKTLAAQRGLLVMGPDCGTSLIGGVGIGFADKVRLGPIGVIGAAGTGLQEFTSRVHNLGYGISHAVGTGSHDLSEQIGGLTTLSALDALEKDPRTQVIAIISKPPAARTLDLILAKVAACKKPVIGCFLGVDPRDLAGRSNLAAVATIDEAVAASIQKLDGKANLPDSDLTDEERLAILEARSALAPTQKYLRGILAGGTFCYQSQDILRKAGFSIHSNSPIDPADRLADPDVSLGHTIVDMGDDHYTVGKPHPMIDGTQRKHRITAESRDPEVAVIYLDFILGYNASMDPAGELVDAIRQARQVSAQHGRPIVFIASVCGTEGDPQDLDLQVTLLQEVGVLVFRSNVLATAACSLLLGKE